MSKFKVGDVCVVNEYSNNTEATIVVVEKTHGTLVQAVDDTPGFWIFADYKLDLLSTAAEMEPEPDTPRQRLLKLKAKAGVLTCGECIHDCNLRRANKMRCFLDVSIERFEKLIAAREKANEKARSK